MNNYIDYYDYNRPAGEMHNEINMPTANLKKFNYNTDPYKAFLRGNLFDNLYKPYKNYKMRDLNPANNRDYELLLVQMYAFTAHDLSLYLDVNPDDVNAIDLRMRYMDAYQEALTNYESSFGPITENSQLLTSTPWAWNSKKWPWEGVS